ncbi:MAG: serine hydrolase, partial [Chloroflexia bacterium]|nr:serine hydrolase [Chloroflexia bacterium]
TKQNLLTTILICFFLLVGSSLSAQNLEAQIDDILKEKFKPNLPGCAAIVVKDGKTIYKKAFGMANMELNVAMKPENISG